MSARVRTHKRRSMRLPGYDYGLAGAYFVTMVTWNRQNLFGEVRDGVMVLNAWGHLVENEWQRLTARFENTELDAFVVMPNHVHGIVIIYDEIVGARREESPRVDQNLAASPPPQEGGCHPMDGSTGARQPGSRHPHESSPAAPLQRPQHQQPATLGTMVGAFKSSTARVINGLRRMPGERIWQRNYYEHIIRNEQDWERIRNYIFCNPMRWDEDEENTSNTEITTSPVMP